MGKTVVQFGGKKWWMYRVESRKQTDVQSKRIIQIDTWIMQKLCNHAKLYLLLLVEGKILMLSEFSF